jgi:PIN domain
MKFDAITIDTNIFDQNHLKLDEGLLKRLRQFKDKLTQFVLSEVIAGELKRHLTRQSQQAKDALASATRKVGDSELLFEQAYWDLLEKADTPNAAEAAQKRLDRFLEATGCEIISANKADMDRLIKMYFDPSAPFETSKNKKSEFPDAIALITMEDWAKQNNKKLLAITKDQGWIDFAAKSDWIFTEQDLAVGLEMLQDDAEIARGIVTSFLNRMENGEEPAALERFQSDIKYEVDDLMPNADGNSGFHMDTPIANVEFKSVQIVHDGDGYDLTIVESSKDAIVARLPIEIEARATATFEFQIKDEGDYLPVASGSGDMTWKFEAGAVLTIIGDYTSTPPALELDDVEMVDAPESVDFGYVEMDIDPDDRYGD